MDRRRDKNPIVEPNAAMPGRKYSEEKPYLCKYCYWKGRKVMHWRRSIFASHKGSRKERKRLIAG